jgi:hypothetical protein
MKNIKIILRSGEEISLEAWQKLYGLKVGSASFGHYFSYTEAKFAQNLRQYGKLIVNELLQRVLDELRIRSGKAVNISAYNRSDEKQEALLNAKDANGKPLYAAAANSPHVEYLAADIKTSSAAESRQLAKLLDEISKELGIKIRIGVEQYIKKGQLFIHLDVCPEYFAKGKPFHNKKHPWQWEVEARW